MQTIKPPLFKVKTPLVGQNLSMLPAMFLMMAAKILDTYTHSLALTPECHMLENSDQ